MCLSSCDVSIIRPLLFGLFLCQCRSSVKRLSSVYPFLSPFLGGGMCTLLTLMTWTFHATLMFAAVSVASDEVLRNILRWFGSVVRSIIFVPTHYISEPFTPVDVADNMIYNIHIGVACGVRCRWYVSGRLVRFSLVSLDVDVLHCPSCIA